MLGPQDFQRVHNELCQISSSHREKLVNTDGSFKDIGNDFERELQDQSKYLQDKITRIQDLNSFHKWLIAKSQGRQTIYGIPTAAEFLDTVKTSNINDETDVSNLMWLARLPSRPYLGVGKHQGFVYCLAPNPNVLVPTHADYDDRQICPENILGVNTNVGAQGRRMGAVHGFCREIRSTQHQRRQRINWFCISSARLSSVYPGKPMEERYSPRQPPLDGLRLRGCRGGQ